MTACLGRHAAPRASRILPRPGQEPLKQRHSPPVCVSVTLRGTSRGWVGPPRCWHHQRPRQQLRDLPVASSAPVGPNPARARPRKRPGQPTTGQRGFCRNLRETFKGTPRGCSPQHRPFTKRQGNAGRQAYPRATPDVRRTPGQQRTCGRLRPWTRPTRGALKIRHGGHGRRTAAATREAMQALRRGRERRGWTMTAAAGHTGISRPHISLLERGLRRPSTSVAEHMIAAYRLTGPEADAVRDISIEMGRPGLAIQDRRQPRLRGMGHIPGHTGQRTTPSRRHGAASDGSRDGRGNRTACGDRRGLDSMGESESCRRRAPGALCPAELSSKGNRPFCGRTKGNTAPS